MDLHKLTASHIGRRITISYPDSGSGDQLMGTLEAVAHSGAPDKLRSIITVKVGDQNIEVRSIGGPWRPELDVKAL